MDNKIILYTTDSGKVTVDVRFEDETFWLTQKAMAEVFGVQVPAISKHLKNVFAQGELVEDVVVSKMEISTQHGAIANKTQSNLTNFYNLDAIISVGYRINSAKATQFRRWATRTLTEYIKKGYLLNDDMLKNGRPFGKDYFDELLERIREIRASERRVYQKIADIFEQCSSDYDKKSETTQLFYKIVQNKLHYAITGKTAAEIIYNRADSGKPFMGLTTWKNSPEGKIAKSDVVIAKNYLNENEIKRLNLLVTMFIDRAEFLALSETVLTMKEWRDTTDEFLNYNKQQVLETSGKISHELAVKKAESEYKKFRIIQDNSYISEFDRDLEKYLKGEG